MSTIAPGAAIQIPSGTSSTVFMHTGSNGRPGGERTLACFDTHRERGVVVLTSGELGEALYRDIVSLIDPESAIARYRWN